MRQGWTEYICSALKARFGQQSVSFLQFLSCWTGTRLTIFTALAQMVQTETDAGRRLTGAQLMLLDSGLPADPVWLMMPCLRPGSAVPVSVVMLAGTCQLTSYRTGKAVLPVASATAPIFDLG